ncbi:MAG: MFS transporter [Calditrichaeota bacterium]|nr:MAG: MFS transporter [Calditrichota bacterium]
MRKFNSLKLYRDAYSGHPPEIWTLAIITLINRIGTMVIPFLTVYLTTILGFSLKQAGILVSAFGFGSLVGSYIAGRLCDTIGENRVILASLFTSGFLLVFLQFAETFTQFFSLIFITAAFGEGYRPALMVAMANYVPKAEMGRTFSFMRLAINLGMSAAPVIGGITAVHLGYAWLFWIDGVTCIAAALYFWQAKKHWRVKPNVEKQNGSERSQAKTLPAHKDIKFMIYIGATLLAGVAFLQWFHSVPVFLKTVWHYDEQLIGILLGFNAVLVVLIEMPAIHALEKAGKTRITLLIGLACIGIAYLFFLMPKALAVCFFALIFWTLGEIFYIPLNNATALNMSPASKRGEYTAWYWMVWSLAHVLGPPLGLGLADELGFDLFWLLLAGLAAVSFFIYQVLLKKTV